MAAPAAEVAIRAARDLRLLPGHVDHLRCGLPEQFAEPRRDHRIGHRIRDDAALEGGAHGAGLRLPGDRRDLLHHLVNGIVLDVRRVTVRVMAKKPRPDG
ncbi:hypothetical protein GCM10023147_39510 [Tsukamurella soli]|uniref:Uncharacterized protein n=1 Tax=Tsukamurella soli TaxID=644556 RepID=A0ABP8K687_9ACTN